MGIRMVAAATTGGALPARGRLVTHLGCWILGAVCLLTARPGQAEEVPVTAEELATVEVDARVPSTREVRAYTRRAVSAPGKQRYPVHTIPTGPIRSAWLAPALPPTPFALAAGEAWTSPRGSVRVQATRISDERALETRGGLPFLISDGEVQVLTAEVVTPRICLPGPLRGWGIHGTLALQAWTNNTAVFDRARNVVEEYLLGAGSAILGPHDIGGRELGDRRERWLGYDPLFRAKVGVKVPLPDQTLFGRRLQGAASAGVTLPAFGASTRISNNDPIPELTAAWSLDLASDWRLAGAATVAWPDRSRRLREAPYRTSAGFGFQTRPVVAATTINLEWWATPRWAFTFGVSLHTPWVRGSNLPMDRYSKYMQLGVMHRLGARDSLHLLFTENLETGIEVRSNKDFRNSQREADFALLFGWRHDL